MRNITGRKYVIVYERVLERIAATSLPFVSPQAQWLYREDLRTFFSGVPFVSFRRSTFTRVEQFSFRHNNQYFDMTPAVERYAIKWEPSFHIFNKYLPRLT
uniref:Uncharacterized protein n=1 Tax=Schistocephalus solidus TaxID=70667 RepID=A0A0X3PIY0_SCHSO